MRVLTVFSRNRWYPEIVAAMAQIGAEAARADEAEPNTPELCRIAPKPEARPVLLTKLGELLRQDYDLVTRWRRSRRR